jgi:hypothetical protein
VINNYKDANRLVYPYARTSHLGLGADSAIYGGNEVIGPVTWLGLHAFAVH